MVNSCGQDDLKKSRTKRFVFHPFELFICGYKNSGKTTLVKQSVARLSKDCSVGYIKHDAHTFEMDHENKDTFLVSQSGASGVFIQDKSSKFAFLGKEIGSYEVPILVNEFDVLLVEGYKDSAGPKILMLDDAGQILKDLQNNQLKNVVAVCGEKDPCISLPFFNRNDIDAISLFAKNYLQSKAPPLFGLILAGGASSRMGQDKSNLIYKDNKPQYKILSELLEPFCNETFLSARAGQSFETGVQVIQDQFVGYGPMGGILSAMNEYAGVSWLVLACDLPFVNAETIDRLVRSRNPFKNATSYISFTDGFPEPLCSIYEPKAIVRMHQFASLGYKCPRKVLINSQIQAIKQSKNELENANTPDEYQHALKVLAEKKND